MKKTYRAFSAGILSEEVYARYDVDKYGSGCLDLTNMVIMAQGGVYKRPGTRFLAPCGNSNKKVRNIKFQFSTEQSYSLEFGEFYMRVFKDGGQVLEVAKTVTGVTQANPGVITSNAHGYSNGQEVFFSGVGGMWELNGRNFKVANVTANTFTLKHLTGGDVDTTGFTAFTAGGDVARVYEIATPYLEKELFALYKAQDADKMTICHPSHDPYELSRTGHTSWTLTKASFAPLITQPTALTAVATTGVSSAVTYKYKVTAVKSDNYEESLVGQQATKAITGATQANPCAITAAAHGYATGDEVYIDGILGMTELNKRYFIITVTGANTFTLNGVDSTAYTAYTSGGTVGRTIASCTNDLGVAGNKNTVSWAAVAGAIKYNIYKEKAGTYGFIGAAESLSFIDDNIDPDVSKTPPRTRLPFDGVNNKPSVVGFHKQRRVFAGSNNKPDTMEMSRAGMYGNMTTSIPNQPDDAISFALASGEVNKIMHLISLRDLLTLTSGQEWRITSDGGLAPSTVEAVPETGYGSDTNNPVPPILIGNTGLFTSDYGRAVRDYRFTFDVDGYEGNDLTILAKHLFKDRYIVDWAYAKVPDKVVWCVMSDGSLLTLTYMREHQVWGWAEHATDGFYESVCAIPDPTNRRDAVYFVVRREVANPILGLDPVMVRYQEILESYIDTSSEDAYFVDCGLSYSGVETNELRGFWHLEGKTLRINGNGNNLAPVVVSGGKVTLQRKVTKAHGGLGYKSFLRPMPTEMDTQQGSTKASPKQIPVGYVEVYRTRGLKGGQAPDDETFGEMVPQFEGLDLSNPIELYTGYWKMAASCYWSRENVAPYLEHDYPLPCKILSVTPALNIGDL